MVFIKNFDGTQNKDKIKEPQLQKKSVKELSSFISEDSISDQKEGTIYRNHLITEKEKKLKNLKGLGRIMKRSKRKKIIRQYSVLNQFSKCNSKIGIFNIFNSLNEKWKDLLKMYMQRAFLIHLHVRQIKEFSELMAQRQNIYDAIDCPDILHSRVNFGNNLVKNFCKGFLHFVVIFSEELVENGLMEKHLSTTKAKQRSKK